MKSKIEKDKKRRKLVQKYETRRLMLKVIERDESLSKRIRWQVIFHLSKIIRDSSKTRVRDRCVLTGRPRGTLRHFKLSRIKFRELASFGLLAGVRKASW